MTQTLWGESKQQHRRRRRNYPSGAKAPYSITGSNDCESIGHTEGYRDLAGCTVCLDCGVKIYCPSCASKHPNDEKAIPILCEKHEAESEARNAV